jgi:hypothetical protein
MLIRWVIPTSATSRAIRNNNRCPMPTKKKSRKRLALYVQAHKRAHAWAEKALLYRSAEKLAQAEAAAKKARHWLRKALVL